MLKEVQGWHGIDNKFLRGRENNFNGKTKISYCFQASKKGLYNILIYQKYVYT